MRGKLLLIFLVLVSLTFLSFPSPVFGDVECWSAWYVCECGPWGDPNPSCDPSCTWMWCDCAGCEFQSDDCCHCTSCLGCFTGETQIEVQSDKDAEGQSKEIRDLEEGDIVQSFDPETGKIKENTVSGILKFTREGYYELETESGNKVKVTGEHPFLAIKGENNQAPSTEFQTTLDKVKDIFSKTLTYKLITGLQTKVSEILR